MIERKAPGDRLWVEFVLVRDIDGVISKIRPVYPVPTKYIVGVFEVLDVIVVPDYVSAVMHGWRRTYPRFVLQDTFVASGWKPECLEDILVDYPPQVKEME